MMTRYEILMLAAPQITEDEAKSIEKNVADLVKNAKGETLSFERWGKCRLAYAVNKHDYGVYFLTRFEIEKNPALFKELQSMFRVKYNEIIMRNVVVKLDSKQGLEYKRPHSVEDAPTRDVDSFLRENKMDGLISSDKPAAKASEKVEAVESVKEEAVVEKTVTTEEGK